MDKLVIGQFSETFPPLMDGVGSVVKNYSELLRVQGHTVHAVVSGATVKKGNLYDKEHGIDYTIRSSMYPIHDITPYGFVIKNAQFKKEVGAIDFDIIHTHTPFFFSRFAERKVRMHNIPLVSTFHTLYRDDIYGFFHSHSISDHLIRLILHHYKVADEVWTPTEWSKKKLQEYGFQGEITVMPNATDFTIPTAEEYEAYRREGEHLAQNSPQTPILLYVGQIKKEKNLELVLEALLTVHQQNIDFKMIFIGAGPDMSLFTQFCEKHELTSKVSFLGKVTDREVVKALMASATLFLFPSQYDTAALVMREAAAFALPLLNTAGSSTAEASQDGFNGFITPNNSDAYARRIIELLQKRPMCQEVGQRAQQTLYLHWDDVIEQVSNRYSELVKRGRKNYP